MNRVSKAVAAFAAVPVLALALAGTASAAPASVHRGTSGCFNWSWADGNVTATVYYHNTCSDTEQIHIWWRLTGGTEELHAPKVAAGAKGHIKNSGTVISIDN